MAWASALNLQDAASRYLAKKIARCTEERIRDAIAVVPPELLIARATAGLIRHRCSPYDDDDDECTTFAEDDESEGDRSSNGTPHSEEMDVMDIALIMVKDASSKINKWMADIPVNLAGPRRALEEAFDAYSEVNPRYDKDFPKHLTGLIIKLLLLRSVFIDRDYGDKDKMCVIPFAWEGWVARLVRKLGPFNKMEELKVYGGMYPNILTAILREAPSLKSLYISHINITDENLMVASKSCPQLEKFYLLHSFPWQVISMKAFCATFFRGVMTERLAKSVLAGDAKHVQKSFKNLKEVELAFGNIVVAKDFHKLLLTYYPELRSFSCEWKTNVFDDQYASHGSDVVIPITRKGKKLSTKKVFLDSGVIYTMSLDHLHKFARNCPDVRSLVLDITTLGTSKSSQSEGRHMLELVLEWSRLDELHFNLHFDEEVIQAYLLPTMMTRGEALRSLILEVSSVYQHLCSSTIAWFIDQCPNLTNLKIHIWQRSMLTVPDEERLFRFPKCKNLQVLSFHEDGPGDNNTPQLETVLRQRWCAVLEKLLKASPNLQTLSISLCRGLAKVLKDANSNIEILHLHVKSCYEWNPTIEKIQELVSYLPNLQALYLEELRGNTYWKIWRYYRYTGLKVHWGNLHGWPRT